MNAANSENDQKWTIYFSIDCFRNAVLSFKAKLEHKGEKLKNKYDAAVRQEELYDWRTIIQTLTKKIFEKLGMVSDWDEEVGT